MKKVDFIEIGTLGDYLGKGGRIVVDNFHIDMGYDNLPVELIRSNGEKEHIRCSVKLTDLITKVITVVNFLPYFIVIETTQKTKSISINRVSEDKLNISDYIVEFRKLSNSELAEKIKEKEAEYIKQNEELQKHKKGK